MLVSGLDLLFQLTAGSELARCLCAFLGHNYVDMEVIDSKEEDVPQCGEEKKQPENGNHKFGRARSSGP